MALHGMHVDLTVVLGRKRLPIGQVLRMRHGALIGLDAAERDDVEILANGLPIARGQVAVRGTAITVEITSLIRSPEIVREPGTTIGASGLIGPAPASLKQAA